ncbi:MAG: flavodoxin domain-containing protein [Pseudomonadota bacterium]
MKVAILYGTESGNAELLCDDIKDEIGEEHDCEISSLADVTPADLEPETFYIFVTATHGNGDLPANAAGFRDTLEEERPDLSEINFAIFGLGDMVFAETFNQGSEKLMTELLACKAQQVGERGIHDASTGEPPEDIALPWVRACFDGLLAKAA